MIAAIYQSEQQMAWLCRTHPQVIGGAMLLSVLSWVGMIGEYWLTTAVLGLELSLAEAATIENNRNPFR